LVSRSLKYIFVNNKFLHFMENKGISRRDFVRRSATGILGTAMLPTVLTSCSNWKGANTRINVGHIGVGVRGGFELISYFIPLTEVMNIAVCDPFKTRREYFETNINQHYKKESKSDVCKSYLDMDEMLLRKDIDAVHITTPDHWHVLAAVKAARAGKHIMLANPLGLSYPQNLVLAKALKDNNVKFHYGTQQRSFEHMQLGYKMIREGLIGEIGHADVWATGKKDLQVPVCKGVTVPPELDFDRWTGPAPLRPYCPELVSSKSSDFNNDYSIGLLGSEGASPLDILVWVLKDKVSGSYTCEGSGKYWPAEVNNNILSWDLNCKYTNGFEVHFVSDDVAIEGMLHHRAKKEGNGTTFYGTKGWISLSNSSAQSNIPELNTRLNSFPKNNRGWISSENNTMGKRFISVVKGEESELCPLEEAIISDTISHMGDIAIRTGRKLTWEPIKGEIVGDAEANKLYTREMRAPYNM
jgi:predicted dehydrogenase